MAQVTLISAVKHDGKDYKPGGHVRRRQKDRRRTDPSWRSTRSEHGG